MLKKIILISLGIVEAFLLYYGICHLIAGYNTPMLVGGSGNACFMGLFIMGFTFMSVFAVLLVFMIEIALDMPSTIKRKSK